MVGVAVDEVELEFVDGLARDGHEPLLRTFSFHSDEFFVEIEVGKLECAEFAHAQTAGEEYLDDGLVALSLGFGEVDAGNDFIHLLHGENVGQVLRLLRELEQLHRVGVDGVGQNEKEVETVDTRQDASEGSGLDSNVDECG